MVEKEENQNSLVERVTEWIGSVYSLAAHTLFFFVSFLIGILHLADWNTVLLILTTVVSLEAIYLAIFIQMTVNRHSEELEEVSEDVEGIQEDIQEINEDVDEIQKDVDEIQGDVDEIQEDVEELSEDDSKDAEHHAKQLVTLEQLTGDIQRVLKDLEAFKKQ